MGFDDGGRRVGAGDKVGTGYSYADAAAADIIASKLAKAHGLLVQSDWRGADLNALIGQQLEAYLSEDADRLRIQGPPVMLPADLATPFGLVLHELATNAAKHGSLSQPKGKVQLSWTVERRNDQRMLRFVWKEFDGPPANQPERLGFGTSLIDRGIPDANVTREFPPDGMVCTIEVPVKDMTNGSTEQRP